MAPLELYQMRLHGHQLMPPVDRSGRRQSDTNPSYCRTDTPCCCGAARPFPLPCFDCLASVSWFGSFQDLPTPQAYAAGRRNRLESRWFCGILAAARIARRTRGSADQATMSSGKPPLDARKKSRQSGSELTELRQEHRDLDAAITAMVEFGRIDTIRIQRMKKRKLASEGPNQRARGSAPPRHHCLSNGGTRTGRSSCGAAARHYNPPPPLSSGQFVHHDRADAAGRHSHGQPIGLGDAAACGGHARFARHRP